MKFYLYVSQVKDLCFSESKTAIKYEEGLWMAKAYLELVLYYTWYSVSNTHKFPMLLSW